MARFRPRPSDARAAIDPLAQRYPEDAGFGQKRGDGLAAVLEQIAASSFGEPLYPTVEERAATILYLVVKNHPLSDGNKRSGALLAAQYLALNGAAPVPRGMLAAAVILTAQSDAAEKDQTVALVQTLLTS